LAVNVTEIFRLHPECYDDEIRDFLRRSDGVTDPFGFSDLTYIRTLEESKQLNFRRDPIIIISASGMIEFGRVLHHLKNRIEDPRTTVLITGWQAPDTLGRRLIEGLPIVRIFGDEYHNRAQVEVLNGFSGHADRDELLAWVGVMGRKPARTFLVHGEEPSARSLAGELQARYGLQVDVPDWKQSFEV
ncbi:MAG: MBL fold metallo-hydrolase, partial [Burkholderiales bacterium]|nr:MBL fold metallo-hydrolase [Anaerolineae bacterium]